MNVPKSPAKLPHPIEALPGWVRQIIENQRNKIARLEKHVSDLEEFIGAAFEAHPNLDLDVENYEKSRIGG